MMITRLPLQAGMLMAVAMMLTTPPAIAQDRSEPATDHAHDHDHDDDARTIAQGYFDDAQVQPRPLEDYAGDWQSVYPYLRDGSLDPVMRHKAETGDKTAEEYRAYYETGYATDTDRITIEGDLVTFYQGEAQLQGHYAADGFEILTYARGNRGVRYVFAKTSGDDDAPDVIQFSDHRIAPAQADHFHLYWGHDRAALLDEVTHWPTYYDAALDTDQIVAEMLAH